MIGVIRENEKPCDSTDEVVPLIRIRPLAVLNPPSTMTSPSLDVVSLLRPSGFDPPSSSSLFRENEKPCEGTDKFVPSSIQTNELEGSQLSHINVESALSSIQTNGFEGSHLSHITVEM